jgi:hypothetical protein
MVLVPRFRMGPPSRSFAADAHDCIMVATLWGRPNTSSWRAICAHDGELPSVSSQLPTASAPIAQVCRCARGRQGQVASRWPSATLDRRSAQQPSEKQVGTRRCRSPAEQGDGPQRKALTPITPYKSRDPKPTLVSRSAHVSGDMRLNAVRTSCGRRWGFPLTKSNLRPAAGGNTFPVLAKRNGPIRRQNRGGLHAPSDGDRTEE